MPGGNKTASRLAPKKGEGTLSDCRTQGIKWARRGLAAIAAAALLGGGAWAAEDTPVDVELVLALDMSSTVHLLDFDLQRRGFADAFRHADIVAAIRSAGPNGIAVAMVQWANQRTQALAMEWTVIHDAASAAALANKIENTPRVVPGGSTAIHGAIRFSLQRLADNGYEGRRKIIDISGDGGMAWGPRPRQERDKAVAQGVTINGLVILDEEPLLDRYFRSNVIGGSGAFVIPVAEYQDFARAIRKKLVLEIADAAVGGARR